MVETTRHEDWRPAWKAAEESRVQVIYGPHDEILAEVKVKDVPESD
jgi:hypothetical protein